MDGKVKKIRAVLVNHAGDDLDKKVEIVTCTRYPSRKERKNPELVNSFYGRAALVGANSWLKEVEAEVVSRRLVS